MIVPVSEDFTKTTVLQSILHLSFQVALWLWLHQSAPVQGLSCVEWFIISFEESNWQYLMESSPGWMDGPLLEKPGFIVFQADFHQTALRHV